jgi:hypothetical protein
LPVPELWAPEDTRSDKLSMKADSILIRIDDNEFEAGIQSVRSEATIDPITGSGSV